MGVTRFGRGSDFSPKFSRQVDERYSKFGQISAVPFLGNFILLCPMIIDVVSRDVPESMLRMSLDVMSTIRS